MNQRPLQRMRLIGVAVLAVATVFLTPLAPAFTAQDVLPRSCQTDCVSAYGNVLGSALGGVPAYSNCNASCVVFSPNTEKGVYTGIKWQCVEFARRWLLVNKGVVYGDVDVAADIWSKISVFKRVADGKEIPVQAHLNGSVQSPEVGDLLIYAKEFLNTGHVAVITAVNTAEGMIEVAEQNFANSKWPGGYARKIEMVQHNGKNWLLDPYLIGWKHVTADTQH